jgi:hypothetical protein
MSPYGDLERVHPRLPNPFDLTAEQLELPATPEHMRLLDWWRAELAALRGFILGPYYIVALISVCPTMKLPPHRSPCSSAG